MSGGEIRVIGMDGGVVLHALRLESGEWHWSGPGWSGVIRGYQQQIVSALADVIGRGEVHRIDVMPGNFMLILDGLGGTWHDGAYWPPHEYLIEITEGKPADG